MNNNLRNFMIYFTISDLISQHKIAEVPAGLCYDARLHQEDTLPD